MGRIMTGISAVGGYFQANRARWEPPSADVATGGPAHPNKTYPRGDGSFASEVKGTAPQPRRDLHFALMANDAYHLNAQGATGTPSERELAQAGWHRLRPVDGHLVDAMGNQIPIRPDMLHDPKTGFDAAIYQNAEGQYVVAYRGTDSWRLGPGGDATTNGGQAIGLATDQYQQATGLAMRALEVFGEGNVVITGHSLGGGLASAAMLATGTPGVTFNAAGLSDNTLRRLNLQSSPNAIREEAAASGQIRRYNVEGDLLTGIQQGALFPPDAVGHELRVAAPAGSHWWNPVEMHGGGGKQPAYVEALRENMAYRPPTSTLVRTTEQIAESAGKATVSFGIHSFEVITQAGQAVGQKSTEIGELMRSDFAQGRVVQGSTRLAGELADGALDIGAGAVRETADFAGDVVREAGALGGNMLRGVGGLTGDKALFNRMASVVENGGEKANALIDAAGRHSAWALDKAGDAAEWLTDRAAAGMQWAKEKTVAGAQWVAEKTVEGARWTAEKVADGTQWVVDKAASGARWATGKAVEGGRWVGERMTDAGRWLGQHLNPANW
ncbi:DUF2974 domain-containing protein [Comamonadaceae bacterium OH2545_COT-014]|nr:DUF2974 domain-containing protein [Comamonadaceae bacterium OH2545_COT-014]